MTSAQSPSQATWSSCRSVYYISSLPGRAFTPASFISLKSSCYITITAGPNLRLNMIEWTPRLLRLDLMTITIIWKEKKIKKSNLCQIKTWIRASKILFSLLILDMLCSRFLRFPRSLAARTKFLVRLTEKATYNQEISREKTSNSLLLIKTERSLHLNQPTQ